MLPVAPVVPVVSVISTGGTIACMPDESGALVPTLTAADLVARSGTDIPTRSRDIQSVDSSSMTLADVDSIVAAVHTELEDPAVCGVVVTHGTDSLADTAYALQLFHSDTRPVILTGAIGTDDGPANLNDAIAFASPGGGFGDAPDEKDQVFVMFSGQALSVSGLIKFHTRSTSPFRKNDVPVPAPLPPVPLGGVNIPVVAAWPGAPADVIDAVAAMQPDGIVVEALGSGNVSAEMGDGIARVLKRGIPVVITTSVALGPVDFAYGGAGGGSTLGALGALPSGGLRAGQARIALAAAIRSGLDPRSVFGGD